MTTVHDGICSGRICVDIHHATVDGGIFGTVVVEDIEPVRGILGIAGIEHQVLGLSIDDGGCTGGSQGCAGVAGEIVAIFQRGIGYGAALEGFEGSAGFDGGVRYLAGAEPVCFQGATCFNRGIIHNTTAAGVKFLFAATLDGYVLGGAAFDDLMSAAEDCRASSRAFYMLIAMGTDGLIG